MALVYTCMLRPANVSPVEPIPHTTGPDHRRENVFNALAAGLVLVSGIVFLAAPRIGFSTSEARISLIFAADTLFLGLLSFWDALMIIRNSPTLDVTLPPRLSGLLGGVTAIAVGILIGKTVWT